MDHIQKNTHPGHLDRYLEAQTQRLRQLTKSLADVDPTDPEAMKTAIKDVVKELVVSTEVLAALTYRASRS